MAVLGDFNDFYSSDALATVAAANGRGPLTNLVVSELPVEERYSYVFEGNSQALDHLLVSPGRGAGDVRHRSCQCRVHRPGQ